MIRSVTPGQQVVKIVHDTLVETLGPKAKRLSLGAPPAPILMVGLQGSGKTTTSAKLALLLQNRDKKRVLMASLDVNRPAAMEQLKVLGEQAGVATLPIILGQRPVDIAKRTIAAARVGGYDVVILDTAGRQHVDEALMAEVAEVKRLAQPHETLLVADSLTGQDAVNIARSFNERVGVTGIILTRADGDQRGGAALSMRAVTGAPIKFLGTGEKLDALEAFHPAAHRLAHSRHGRRRHAGRKSRRACRPGEGGEARQENEEGRARLQRSRRSAVPDAQDGRHAGPARACCRASAR